MISPTVGDSLSAVLIPVVVGLVCGTPSSRLFYLDPLYRTYWINEFGTYFYPLIFIDTLHVMGLDSQIVFIQAACLHNGKNDKRFELSYEELNNSNVVHLLVVVTAD